MGTKGIFACPKCGGRHWMLVQTSKNFFCICANDSCEFAVRQADQFKFHDLNEKSASANAL